MKLEEFLDGLSHLEFEEFAEKAVIAIGHFRNVRREVFVSGWQVDLMADEVSPTRSSVTEWIFQVKSYSRSRIGSQVIQQLLDMSQQTSLSDRERKVALITRTRLTRQAAELARACRIEVWDPPGMLEILPHDFLKEEIFDFSSSSAQTKSVERKSKSLAEALGATKSGREQWSAYQSLCSEIMQFLFCPPLEVPMAEVSDQEKRNRRDIILENGVGDGFWARIRVTYDAHYIVADAKNYKSPLKKEPILSVSHYLKPHGCGMFGIVLSRAGAGPAARHAIKEQWIGSRKLIVVLTDQDVLEMLRLKSEANDPEQHLGQLIRDFRLSL